MVLFSLKKLSIISEDTPVLLLFYRQSSCSDLLLTRINIFKIKRFTNICNISLKLLNAFLLIQGIRRDTEYGTRQREHYSYHCISLSACEVDPTVQTRNLKIHSKRIEYFTIRMVTG